MNVEVAFTMKTDTIHDVLASLEPYQSELRLPDGSQLQIVGSLSEIMTTTMKKFQYACLVVQEGLLLVWHDDIQQILPHASVLEEKLLSLVKNFSTASIRTILTRCRFGDPHCYPSVLFQSLEILYQAPVLDP